MGCDIHMYCEIKNNGRWEKVGPIFRNEYFDPSRKEHGWNVPFTDIPYDGRNYDLFAILANVRNGYGFAGCDTGDGFVPISDPRGLPENVSDDIKLMADEFGMDGHSHSYLTLRDIQQYNWNQVTNLRGIFNLKEFKILQETGRPESYCGGVFGADIVMLSNEEMLDLIDGVYKMEKGKRYYTQVEWGVTYKEVSGSFYNDVIPKLVELADGSSPDNVRLVFWFDN